MFNESSENKTKMRDIMENKNKNWQKIVSDRLVKRIMKYREDRIDNIRLNKEEIINEFRIDSMIDDYNEDILLSEYFDKILSLFENKTISDGEYELELGNNSNISFCPLCFYPVISTNKKVICLQLCFEFSIPKEAFSFDFTLENLMDLFHRTLKEHMVCHSPISVINVENEVNLVCEKCFINEYFNLNN